MISDKTRHFIFTYILIGQNCFGPIGMFSFCPTKNKIKSVTNLWKKLRYLFLLQTKRTNLLQKNQLQLQSYLIFSGHSRQLPNEYSRQL